MVKLYIHIPPSLQVLQVVKRKDMMEGGDEAKTAEDENLIVPSKDKEERLKEKIRELLALCAA